MKTLLFITAFLFILATPAYAAELYFGFDSTNVAIGQTFRIGVLVNSEGESVNAYEAEVTYPSENLSLLGIESGGSIVTNWIVPPVIPSSCDRFCRVSFAGITPGGFNGPSGELMNLIFQSNGFGPATIDAVNVRVLLNDGVGSEASNVRSAPVTLEVIEGTGSNAEAMQDTEPPERFTPTIERDPNVYDGQWFLVFGTQDKASGIDHYEVQEGDDDWTLETSPYLLRDQARVRSISIRAIDHMGNVRIEVIPASVDRTFSPWLGSGIIALLIIGGWIVWKKFRKK